VKARLLATTARVRASYWFIPTLMAVGAAALAVALPWLDAHVGDGWIGSVNWLFATKPSGARELLSMIAGSMITVAGVTFSITIASVAYATSQFGPRLLTNFMADRGNQVTLGTFTATFLYCLLVLRTIRAADEPEPGASAPDVIGAFVPQIAVLVALALAVASIGVLIFFIHHVPQSIHASSVAANLGRGLREGIEHLFPERIGHGGAGAPAREVPAADLAALRHASAAVPAPKTGYVEVVDAGALLDAARRHDIVVFLPMGPGASPTRPAPRSPPRGRSARSGRRRRTRSSSPTNSSRSPRGRSRPASTTRSRPSTASTGCLPPL